MTIAELEHEIYRRKRGLRKLERQRVSVARKLAKVDAKIARINGANGNGHARNEQSLIATLEAVMRSGKPMGVGAIVADVQRRGYKSHSANFRGIVNQTLIKEKRFASAGRGVYQLAK
jgi:septal ring factor EnvC (AmiA/AmiB activator)